jgi:hypothetical protein
VSLVGVLFDVRGNRTGGLMRREIQCRVTILFEIYGAAPLVGIVRNLAKYSQLGQLSTFHGEPTVPRISVINNGFHG